MGKQKYIPPKAMTKTVMKTVGKKVAKAGASGFAMKKTIKKKSTGRPVPFTKSFDYTKNK